MSGYQGIIDTIGKFFSGSSELPTATVKTIPGTGMSYPAPGAQRIANLMGTQLVNKNPWTMEEIQNRLNNVSSPTMKEYGDLLANQRDALKEYSKPATTNLSNISPILGASDILSGTDFMKTYKSPEQNQRDRLAQQMSAQEGFGKNLQGLSNIEKDLLTAQLMATMGTTTQSQKETPIRTGAGATPQVKPDQVKAAGFAKRMQESENILSQLGTEGYNPSSAGSAMQGLLGGPLEGLKSDQRKSFEQTRRSFINAQLRRESGAAISDKELAEGNRQYFPTVGDSPAVLVQKAAARQQAAADMQAEAGPAYAMMPTVTTTRTPKITKAPIVQKQTAPTTTGTPAPMSFDEWKKAKGGK